jgi:hypothetical protein
MDCKTARLLLDFARPQARELEAEEAGALEGHLDQCSDCHGLARGERELDATLGKAMRQVEVPVGLRDQLLHRLEAQRGDWQRQRFAHRIRIAAAALAASLLLSWGVWHWIIDRPRPQIDPNAVAEAVNDSAAEDARVKLEEALKRMGVDTPLSPHLNYNLLIAPPGLAELPGYPTQKVAMLVFSRNGRHATVYVVATEQLPSDVSQSVGGATYKVEVLAAEGERYTFLVVHDGENLDWLRPHDPRIFTIHDLRWGWVQANCSLDMFDDCRRHVYAGRLLNPFQSGRRIDLHHHWPFLRLDQIDAGDG